MAVTLGQPLGPDRRILHALLDTIIATGRWANDGPIVRQLESELAAGLGWGTVLATSSGTSALTIAMLALDLPPGAEVITSPLTFPATIQAIEMAGLTPVFVGVDAETLCLDPAAVEAAIGPRTAAIVPVHLFGIAVDPQIDAIARQSNVPVVYDAAHAYGFPSISGRGTATAYSMHATKLLHAGEGGFVATDDPLLVSRLALARNFGLDAGRVRGKGTNAKMSEPSAAIGLAVLPRVPDELVARRRLRDAYESALADSSRYRVHAPGNPRALVMELVRCDPRDQQQLLDDLATRDVIGRRFSALCAPDERYAGVRLVGAAAGEVVELARSGVAIPLHGRVNDRALEAIVGVLSR